MFKTLDSQTSRAVVFGRRPSSAQTAPGTLKSALTGLRTEMDSLTVRLAREHGVASQATVRAEQISHAIQRLEWALDRQQSDPETR